VFVLAGGLMALVRRHSAEFEAPFDPTPFNSRMERT
jgi:hypothetical protein